MIDELINKQVEEHDKVGVCDCGCHTSPHSDADMKINGCDYCYEGSEYAPRHPDKRNVLVSSMKKVGEEMKKKIVKKFEKLADDAENAQRDNPREMEGKEFDNWNSALRQMATKIRRTINSLTEGE